MHQELVSIITPAFNSQEFLPETAESIFAQTHTNWEWIIVDDGSTDNTLSLAQEYSKKNDKIKVYHLEKSSGRPAIPRRYGIEKAKGDYITFLDSDDIWFSNKLDEQIRFMKEKSAPVSFHQYRRFTNDINSPGALLDVPEKLVYKNLLKQNIIGCLTGMIDKRMVGDIETWRGHRDDYVIWLRILKKGHTAFGLKKDLARYRVSPNAMSKNKFKAAIRTWQVYRESEKLNIFDSAYYFVQFAFRSLKKYSKF